METALELARRFYEWWATHPASSKLLAYMEERGLNETARAAFHLGAAPRYGDTLYRCLRKKGLSEEELLSSGLFVETEEGIRDRFYSRVMFPITSADGRVIGFGARKVFGSGPKYLNSPQTADFVKGDNLYALDRAKDDPRPYFILCEGYMDVISLHCHGFGNAVAGLGTALTENQAALIRQYKEKGILLYDADEAGQNATEKAIGICRGAGLTVRISSIPEPYKDPDEFFREKSPDDFMGLLMKSKPDTRWLIDRAYAAFDRDGDAQALSDALIGQLKDPERILKEVNH